MGFLQILKDFATWSTVCGVPHIANAQTMRWRLFWSAVFVCMVSMFIYELYLIITKFIAFPVDVSTEIVFEEQQFPVVTVCNANPYKLSVIESNSSFDKVETLMNTYRDALAQSLTSDVGKYGLYDKMSLPYQLDQRAREALALEVAQLSPAVLNRALYNADFTRFVDPIYGACYSFNEDSSLNYSTNRAGMKFGLKLLVTVSQETTELVNDFLPTTAVAGARIAIHPRGVQPLMDNLGINVGVGYQTAIALTSILVKYKRMKKPYGRCVDREPEATNLYKTLVLPDVAKGIRSQNVDVPILDIVRQRRKCFVNRQRLIDKTYTLDTCFAGCRQRDTVSKCGCANPRYYKTASQVFCRPIKTDLDCLGRLRGDQVSTTAPNICPLTDCTCDPPCSEVTYSTTASIAKFPAENYYVATNNERGVISAALNDLGGHAGLWLGLSVISVVEVCGLIILLVMYCVTCGGLKTRPDDDDLAADERIQVVKLQENHLVFLDVEEVKKELDIADENEKDLDLSDEEDEPTPKKEENAKEK
ncbi:unnamed protein product [Strongylus vulgaris]|uniref:Amiloride-sensitive sodium channel n=1 Tax=Strongylus vulgaris TaxID=40348 RepID=A0A3P7J7R0_STRVU|nr:unnamed protein product [Strongylus vulgaris]